MRIVTNQTEFKDAISGMEPEIIVANNISLLSQTNIGYTVTIRGQQPGVSLLWTGAAINKPMMLVVTTTGNLTIESLTLDAEARNGTLVHVNGGKFTMNDGAILKNIYSRSARNAVSVGDLVSSLGGTFIMNGGLITEIDSADAVFCGGGAVFMNNDAAISGNMSAGITMTDSDGVRSSLTMSGRSRISENQSKQGCSAGIILGTDIIMGVSDGDAPIVTGNHDPDYSIGGWLLSDNSTLTMRYNAEISDNDTVGFGGGLAAQSRTAISMYDNAVIKNNRASFGAGLILATNSTLTMEGNAQIFGNVSSGRAGGIELQSGSGIQMKDSAAIHGNSAVNGAGIYLNTNTVAFIGSDNSSPEIYNNEATGRGGGIFISERSTLNLSGQANIYDNYATQGKGIYKMGTLNLCEAPLIQDGLFFDDLQADATAISLTQANEATNAASLQVPFDSPEHVLVELLFSGETAESDGGEVRDIQSITFNLQQAYCDNVPVIVDTLTGSAQIQLEASGYVSTPNVPLVIADKGTDYAQLGETDRAAWRIPQDFGLGYAVILNPALDQVLIDLEAFQITYHNLFGVENPNPDTYRASDLPIILNDPKRRTGYTFAGWYDASGELVTQIPVGTTGDLSFTAAWKKLKISFDGNARHVCNVPKSIPVEQDTSITIPHKVPIRSCHEFIGWNVPSSGSGKVYFPNDTILISEDSITLYAQWHRNRNCNQCGD